MQKAFVTSLLLSQFEKEAKTNPQIIWNMLAVSPVWAYLRLRLLPPTP